MLDSILLTPDNRFLSLSTQDFGLYGGQTPLHLQVGQAAGLTPATPAMPAGDGGAIAASDSAPLAASPANLTVTPADAMETPAATTPFGGLSQTIQPTALDAPQVEVFGAPPVAAALAPFVPAFAAPSLPIGPGGSGGTVSPAIAGLNPAASLLDTIESLSPMTALTAPLLLGDAVAGVTTLVGTTAQTLADAQTLDTTTLTDTLNDATAGAGALVEDAATGAVAPLAATVGPLAGAAVSFVEDDLAGLPGTDPLGGVATLVSLVSADDLFDVGENSPDSLVNTPAPDLLSTLADDVLPDGALLGDHDDDDGGALAGLTDDDPLGMF